VPTRDSGSGSKATKLSKSSRHSSHRFQKASRQIKLEAKQGGL
jgi:hypothetical protein